MRRFYLPQVQILQLLWVMSFIPQPVTKSPDADILEDQPEMSTSVVSCVSCAREIIWKGNPWLEAHWFALWDACWNIVEKVQTVLVYP